MHCQMNSRIKVLRPPNNVKEPCTGERVAVVFCRSASALLWTLYPGRIWQPSQSVTRPHKCFEHYLTFWLCITKCKHGAIVDDTNTAVLNVFLHNSISSKYTAYVPRVRVSWFPVIFSSRVYIARYCSVSEEFQFEDEEWSVIDSSSYLVAGLNPEGRFESPIIHPTMVLSPVPCSMLLREWFPTLSASLTETDYPAAIMTTSIVTMTV